MFRKSTNLIDANTLKKLVKRHCRADKDFDVRRILNKAGYDPVLDHLDLPDIFAACGSTDLTFDHLSFNHCKLVGGEYGSNVFHDCCYEQLDEDAFLFEHCLAYLKSNDGKRFFDDPTGSNAVIDTENPKPLIGVVYCPSHGTSMTDMMLDILKSRGLSIVLLNPAALLGRDDDGPQHPIFNHIASLDGIFLPGGFNVITDAAHYTVREKLEKYLMDLSVKYKIPTLGVCRGHQFIGHYFGAEIRDVPNHQGNIIHVSPRVNSKLFHLTEKKYQKQTLKRNLFEIEETETGYAYASNCCHRQGLFFNEPPQKRVKIAATAEDQLPESLQVADHIITFQHHHEARWQVDHFARSVIKMYVSMVNDFHEKKHRTRSAGMHLYR